MTSNHYYWKYFTFIITFLLYHVLNNKGKFAPGAGNFIEKSNEINNNSQTEEKKIPFPKPESYNSNEIESHGMFADIDLSASTKDKRSCLTCHKRNDCIQCHTAEKPLVHINSWHTLGHRFKAEGNRELIIVCQKRDYCVRCRNKTEPGSHIGNWNILYCSQYHFSSSFVLTDRYIVCHKQAAHSSAPHPVNSSVNCELCYY